MPRTTTKSAPAERKSSRLTDADYAAAGLLEGRQQAQAMTRAMKRMIRALNRISGEVQHPFVTDVLLNPESGYLAGCQRTIEQQTEVLDAIDKQVRSARDA